MTLTKIDADLLKAEFETSKEVDQGTNETVNKIFKQLRAIFPAWKASVSGNPQTWGNEQKALLRDLLISKNISQSEQIEIGLNAAADHSVNNQYMPTMGQFVEWCHPRHVPKIPYHSGSMLPPPRPANKTKEAVDRSRQIKEWYTRRIMEASEGKPINYEEPKPWDGAISAHNFHPAHDCYVDPVKQHTHDQAARRSCHKIGVPYFAPDGSIDHNQ